MDERDARQVTEAVWKALEAERRAQGVERM
jgi:hypothetical protein